MSVKQVLGRLLKVSTSQPKFKAERRKAVLGCESFEDRVVLSHMGGFPGGGFGGARGRFEGGPAQVGTMTPKTPPVNILGSLGSLGILSMGEGLRGPGGFGHNDSGNTTGVPPQYANDATATTLFTNLKTAMDQLRTDSQAIAAASGVTVADMSALMSDAQAIMQTGSTIDTTKLESAVSGLAYAVAGGTDQTQAKADFAAVFSGTSVTQATIDKTTADLVQAITDSKVTTANLDTLKADKAAVDAAQQALKDAGYAPGGGKDGCKDKSTTTTSSTSSSSSSVTVASSASLKGASKGAMRVRRAGRHR